MNRRPIVAGIRSSAGDPEEDGELDIRFREAMSRLPAGVTVVAVRDEDEVVGITVSAFTSVSADPPLILVCIGINAAILPFLRDVGRFTVNLLGEGSRAAASRFAQQMPDDPTLFAPGEGVLRSAAASLICDVEAIHPGGDHEIVVGRVAGVSIGPDEPPLVYYGREYRELA